MSKTKDLVIERQNNQMQLVDCIIKKDSVCAYKILNEVNKIQLKDEYRIRGMVNIAIGWSHTGPLQQRAEQSAQRLIEVVCSPDKK